MISIIICSRSKDISQLLKNNIAKTIGCPYELIVIDNSTNQYSIFSAYNKGVQQSKFPYLCFMHDDIIYQTNNWGNLVKNHFNDEKTGAIGVAGTPYMPLMPGSWWAGEMVNINIIHPTDNGEAHICKSYPDSEKNKNLVAVLDGVWLCICKKLFNTIKFDESFKGFHCYDTDISLQVYQAGYNLYSIFDILIKHDTTIAMNTSWIDNVLRFRKKWGRKLPIAIGNISYIDRCEAEIKTLDELVYMMLKNKVRPKKVYLIAFAQLSRFLKGYFYYRTPIKLTNYLIKAIIK